ncbi:hypothetical protein [Nostoc sp.]
MGHQLHENKETCNPQIGTKMKVDGNGQGKILTQDELRRLFTEGFLSPRDRLRRAVTPSRFVWDLPFHWLSRIRSTSTPDD